MLSMESLPCALKNTKIVETAKMGGPLATAGEARCVATALPRLAIAACCEATGVPGPRFRLQPG